MTRSRSLPAPARLRQQGLSIVELLVGITIGLLVVVAAVGSLVFTRVSSTVVGDSLRLQQDASTAFRIIGHHIRQGGARRLVGGPGGGVVFNSLYSGHPLPNNGPTVVIGGTDGVGDATDTLQISNNTAASVPNNAAAAAHPWPNQNNDCIGERTVFANTVVNVFAVSGGQLTCDGSGATVGNIALVQGVEDFQVWLGVRNLANNDLTYKPLSTPGLYTPDNNQQIATVMVCLRMAGQTTGNPGVATPGCQRDQSIADDGRIRRVFFRVFNLRNTGL